MSGQSYPPPPGYGYQPQPQQPQGGAGMAVTALVLGVIALLGSITIVVGILVGLIAVVLGLVASGRAKRGRARGRGMAIVGVVTGSLGIVVAGGLIALGVSIINSDTGKDLRDCLADAGDDQEAIAQCQRDFEDELLN